MIRFLKHSEIDPARWDQTVRNSLTPTIFVEYAMLDLLTGDGIWHALVEDDYDAIMPLPTRQKGVLKYVYTPFFLRQMGIFSARTLTPDKVESFLKEVSQRYVLADVLMNVNSTPKTDAEAFYSYALSLQPSYDALQAAYSKNARKNLKAAQNKQCRVTVQEESITDVIDLFRLNRGKERNVQYHPRDYAILERISEKLLNDGLLDIYGVRTPDNELAAGALFPHDFNCRSLLFSGRDNRLSACKPMYTLMDAYIRDHAETGCVIECYTNNPNMADFYQGFGGQRYSYAFVRRFKNRFWKTLLSPKLSKLT
jgi:hypothetical protein